MNKLPAQITLRSAVWEDAEFLLSLRNDPLVCSQSIQARSVGRQEHLEWFKETLQRNDVKLFIILDNGVPVGQVRYDLKHDGALVSMAINDGHRGKGLGAQALKQTSQKIFFLPEVKVLKALIKEDNKASLRCFESTGFCPVGREKHGDGYFTLMELRKVF